jgi:hypothetical protein
MHSPYAQVAKLHWIKIRMWHEAMMKDPDLSDRAARLVGILWHYINGETGVAWPSIEVLARDMGKSPSTVKRALSELRARDGVTVKRRRDGGNIYQVPERFAAEAAAQLAGQLKSAPAEGANLTPNTDDRYSRSSTACDAPCGAAASERDLDEIGERALDELIKAIREAAGVRAPFSVHWSDASLCRVIQEWVLELDLRSSQIVGAIREMRRDRPGVRFNSPAYFTDRMADIAAENRGADRPAVTATDYVAAVVGRERAEEYVELWEECEQVLSPSFGRMIADQLRAYDDPQAALDRCLANGSLIPSEDGFFRARAKP